MAENTTHGIGKEIKTADIQFFISYIYSLVVGWVWVWVAVFLLGLGWVDRPSKGRNVLLSIYPPLANCVNK